MASSAETYCLCGQPYNVGQFMIECDCCREWFHGSCVNVKVYQSEDIDKYHCPKCAPTYGPSIYRVATNDHRQDRYELNADRKPMQAGSRAFVTSLAARQFPPSQAILLHGPHFTENYLKEKGFNNPLLFENSAGLDLRVPPANAFSVRTVARHCGASREIDVIDVTRQTNFKMTLGDFVDYFTSTPEERADKVLNVLSLEFSDTPMASVVWPPLMARQLDWVRVVWPAEAAPLCPLVQRYCIMSPTGSYTDFHVDFGGTSVWYHVLHGQKIFYLIPPTPANLALYQQWSTSLNQSEVFFAELVEHCGVCVLKRGQTLFIPTGWIHAVLTPEDSLVFGGNFLHSLNIELQLQVNEIEKQIDTPTIFRFPSFETIHWYAGAYLLQKLRRFNEEQQDKDFTLKEGTKEGIEMQKRATLDMPSYLYRGVKILAAALKEWNACKSYDQSKKDAIPDTINSGQLVRELARELRRLERILPQTAPASHQAATPKKKKKKPKPQEPKLAKIPPISNIQTDRHFAAVSNTKTPLPSMPLNYDPINPRSLYNQHSNAPSGHMKKSLKLTLPKPIMHVPDSNHMFSNSSQDSEDAELNNMANLASRSSMASYSQGYDSQDSFGGENDYRVPGENVVPHEGRQKKSSNPYTELTSNERGGAVLKIKLGSPPSTSIEEAPRNMINQGPPPDYATTEHSILKSHLIGNSANMQRQQKSSNNQWTISKSQVKNNINDTTDEQILFTNENLTMPSTSHSNVTSYVNSPITYEPNGMIYGPGMYSGDGVQPQVIQPDTYDPEYVIDRKDNGLGLPDYSPTKSMSEYLGQTKQPSYLGPVETVNPAMDPNLKPDNNFVGTPSNFANNSDPYAQGIRPQDEASPFSDDSAIMPADAYKMIPEDQKVVSVVQAKMEVTEYVGNEQGHMYDYVDSKGHVYKATDQGLFKIAENVYKTENGIYKADQNIYKTDQNLYKTDQNLYKTDQNIYKTDHNIYKTDQMGFKLDQNVYKTDQMVYKNEQILELKKDIRNNMRHGVLQTQGDNFGQNILVYNTVNTGIMESPSIPPPAYAPENVVTPPRRTERPTRRRTDPRSSIYDYEDPDESGMLYIDEAATPTPPSKSSKKKAKDSKGIKITIPAHVYRQENESGRNPGGFSAPKNGIESLLQASAYTGSSDNQERDAVAGMLSIGQSYGLARAEPSTRRTIAATEAPPIRAVHKDDEYVYPSLDMSSDEEDDLPPSRKTPSKSSRKKTPYATPSTDREDESWSPRGRLGRLLPRQNRPSRRGSRREAVQAALRAARLRGAQHDDNAQMAPVSLQSCSSIVSLPPVIPPSPLAAPPPPLQLPAPPPTPSQPPPLTILPVVTATTIATPHRPATLREPQALTSLKKPYRKKRPVKPARPVPVQHVLPSPTTPKVVKFKKGMKTAKQRLGKILKIHKMMC